MRSDVTIAAPGVGEIVSGNVSGGPNTSHTIVIESLAALLDALPTDATEAEYEEAALKGNILGKQTDGARRRTFRYLKELYLLRANSLLFRALRDLWGDVEARPLLAGLCALARDPVFRASSSAILEAAPGEALTSRDLAAAVGEHFPSSYRDSTLAKIGRNVFSSWEQTRHLTEGQRAGKIRRQASCRPADVAYGLMFGHIQGIRGPALFETFWAKILDQPTSQLFDLASNASQQGLLEFRHGGGVIEVGFDELLRPFDGELT